MNWNQRPYYKPFCTYGESQLEEGGPNASDNCVPTSMVDVVKVLGGPHLEPAEIVAEIYGNTYHGYTDYAPIERGIRERWPNCPPIVYGNPAETLKTVDLYAANGYPVCCSFWVDNNANLSGPGAPNKHVSPIVAHEDGLVTILNVWNDQFQTVNEATFNSAVYGDTGWLAMFQRDLRTISPVQEAHKVQLNAPVVAGFGTKTGRGYTMVCADGGVFPYGDAQGYGSLGGQPINAPITSAAPTADDGGYWLFGADGGVFPFGNAPGIGSLAGGADGRAEEADSNEHQH